MTLGAHASFFTLALLLGGCVLQPLQPGPTPAKAREPESAASAVAAPAERPASAPTPAVPAAGLPPPADAAVRDLLTFHDRVRQLPPPDLAAEMARLNDEPPGPRTTLQLALLLGQTRSNGDLARALAVLEPLLRSTAPEVAPWQPLARLVAARYAEQRRLEEQVERQNQQARENQRKLEQLNEKLEALKAIERSLTTRPPPAGGGGAASAPPGVPPAAPAVAPASKGAVP
jgi:hypothetical protein